MPEEALRRPRCPRCAERLRVPSNGCGATRPSRSPRNGGAVGALVSDIPDDSVRIRPVGFHGDRPEALLFDEPPRHLRAGRVELRAKLANHVDIQRQVQHRGLTVAPDQFRSGSAARKPRCPPLR